MHDYLSIFDEQGGAAVSRFKILYPGIDLLPVFLILNGENELSEEIDQTVQQIGCDKNIHAQQKDIHQIGIGIIITNPQYEHHHNIPGSIGGNYHPTGCLQKSANSVEEFFEHIL